MRVFKSTDIQLKDTLLSLTASLLLILAYPKADCVLLAWVALVPLLLSLRDKSFADSFKLAYLSGFGFFLFTLSWLAQVTRLGYLALVTYLAVYFGLFGVVFSASANFSQRRSPVLRFVFISCAWVGLEYLRSRFFGGFGWALLAYSQYRRVYLIQASDIFGCWGVSFALIFTNAALAYFISHLAALRKPPGAGTARNSSVRLRDDVLKPVYVTAAIIALMAFGLLRILGGL